MKRLFARPESRQRHDFQPASLESNDWPLADAAGDNDWSALGSALTSVVSVAALIGPDRELLATRLTALGSAANHIASV